MSTLTPINIPNAQPISSSSPINISTASGTDLWRKPPSTNSTNAPGFVEYRPITNFKSARVTVDAKWDRLYDQGGLVFFLPPKSDANKGSETYEAWVKTGIEMFDGKPNVGTVATPPQGYSDWSLVPTPPGTTSATIEIAREKGGPSLYVYLVEGEKKTLIREVTWVFRDVEQNGGLLGVGVYAARPTKVDGETDKETLTVHFEGLKIEWTNE